VLRRFGCHYVRTALRTLAAKYAVHVSFLSTLALLQYLDPRAL
jgi:hypothetical protein